MLMTTAPYFESHSESYLALHCPCGSENLHQQETTIFARSEDDSMTTVIEQKGREAEVYHAPSEDTRNPSARRHGLIIRFVCEQCSVDKYSKPLELAIWQHKGTTFVGWIDG